MIVAKSMFDRVLEEGLNESIGIFYKTLFITHRSGVLVKFSSFYSRISSSPFISHFDEEEARAIANFFG